MTATLNETFADQGFLHVKQYFRPSAVEDLERQLVDLFAMQARKIGEYRDAVDALMASGAYHHAKISGILDLMEADDKVAAYQAQKFIRQSPRVHRFYDQGFVDLVAHLIGSRSENTLIEGPDLFVSKPGENRLKYQNHTEALFYPKRRRFMNVWLPLFSDRTVENGAMTVRPRSHKRVWDSSLMVEYSGWDKAAEGKRSQFVQLEIPECFLAEYSSHVCVSSPGDAILFDRNLVHKSNENLSDDYSFALVCRVWDPSDDLTLSGDMSVTPYNGGNVGRPNLVVNP